MAASDSFVPNLYAEAVESHVGGRPVAYSALIRSCTSAARPAADLLAAAICTYLAYYLASEPVLSLKQRVVVSIVVGIVAAFSNSHEESSICNLINICETEAILRSALLSQTIFLSINFLLGSHLHIWQYGSSFFAVVASMMMARGVTARILRLLHEAGYGAAPVVIYGHPETTNQIASAILRSPFCGLHPIALIHDDSLNAAKRMFRARDTFSKSIPVISGPLTLARLKSFRCHLLILAAPHLLRSEIEATTDIARECGSSVAVLSTTFESEDPIELLEVDGLHLVTGVRTVSARHSNLLKRMMDVSIATILILLGLPVFLAIALCIKLDSPGPVLFEQQRVGRNGELFTIFKFRSMHVNSPMYEASPTESTDPRITRVGRLLRRTGLDETAQLLNVLFGHMSLVGPRPEMPFLVERNIRHHQPRLQATPGITGLWQLSTDRAFPIHENTHYDLFYIRKRTCCMDAAIILHTLLFAMRGGV